MILDLISTALGFIGPPAFDFIKKKFLKPKQDTPEATLSTLATTKPEIIDKFVLASASLLKAKIDFFNRDVIGAPSQWVVDLRASIRPLFVIASIIIKALGFVYGWNIDESFTILINTCIGSWFSCRLNK